MLALLPVRHDGREGVGVSDQWARGVSLAPNDQGFFGSTQIVIMPPGSTALRTWWNFSCFYLNEGVNTFPPGSSILRVGLLYADNGLDVLNTPTPISDPGAEWMGLTTLNPHVVQFERGTTAAWNIHWGTPTDFSAKSQRRNSGTTNKGLYVSWEFARKDTPQLFRINRWNASIDCYLRTPDV
jgi:hypothetical protein